MDNVLFHYFTNRYQQKEKDTNKLRDTTDAGPVVTVSREFGCHGKEFSRDLKQRLETQGKPWQIVSKEVLDHAAKELKLHPRQLEYVFKGERRSDIEEMLTAMSSRFYKGEYGIRKALRKVIYKLAYQGNAIILGRCGVCIAQDIEKSLHVKLEAPVEHRIANIMQWKSINADEAARLMNEMDKNREFVLHNFSKKVFDPHMFDLKINMGRFNVAEAVDLTVKVLEMKNIVRY
ncbi:MAG: cytidylate kinase-like family protein [Bacteroidales bacterium]|nr:cytidylate kinase-like family protein [Bacteroidales bacterium]